MTTPDDISPDNNPDDISPDDISGDTPDNISPDDTSDDTSDAISDVISPDDTIEMIIDKFIEQSLLPDNTPDEPFLQVVNTLEEKYTSILATLLATIMSSYATVDKRISIIRPFYHPKNMFVRHGNIYMKYEYPGVEPYYVVIFIIIEPTVKTYYGIVDCYEVDQYDETIVLSNTERFNPRLPWLPSDNYLMSQNTVQLIDLE
jgi:hypothetical protein